MPLRSAVMLSTITVRSVLAGSRSTSIDTVGPPICVVAQPLNANTKRQTKVALISTFLRGLRHVEAIASQSILNADELPVKDVAATGIVQPDNQDDELVK